MDNDARFGLELSLVEALRADPSPDAAELAELLTQSDPPPRSPRPTVARAWRSVFVGLTMTLSLGAQAYAATPNLEGRWTMAASGSSFREAVTGPAPDEVTVVVTRDDPERLDYQMSESRGGDEVAQAAYDLSFSGQPSTSAVNGLHLPVTASRDEQGGVVIRARVGELQAMIHLRRTGPDAAVIEHDIEGPDGALSVERISLVRAGALAAN